jgi:hypothetical protein
MKKYLVLLFTLSAMQLIAQDAEPDMATNKEKMRAYKIGFITDKLELSSKESTVFWPVYNDFEEQMQAIKARHIALTKTFRQTDAMSDAVCEKFISKQISLRQQEVDLIKKYTEEFKKVLPIQKVATLLTLEHQFKQDMMKRVQERRGRR